MLQEAKEVCPTTTRRLIGEGALLVDVREPHEVQALALDVAEFLCIPLSELETRWSEIPKDREVVMVCQGGERSLKATYYMQYHGYTQVSNMSGGIEKWNRKGFPVKGQMPAGRAAASGCCSSESVVGGCDANSCCAGNVVQHSDTSCCGGAANATQQKASCC
ncbi:hydrolase [Rhodoferax lacus]|uniref:Hydrolase n=1 Tax=Rhodoferax lacus TaxID=2184758 RepID=A0A3E1RAY3_9BURK|nr:rhodanese-like domain-containing protein [Rhodoferax lacus]RFO96413.1 hydrolase [Rhodoferax lacus]